ncbi:MAG TPA: thiamine phosphate synthase [Dongiaceae bacterium]|nr:thiamine phosphate synthase [Dongiaceae bacterium]
MTAPAHRLAAGIDLSLYFVTDRALCGPRGLIATVRAALQGGITALQYRAKHATLREALAEASILAAMAHEYGVPFIINDRLDLALATEADGLHVGQSDMPVALVRRLLGPDKILGLSITHQRDIDDMEAEMIDYVGLGPVFATATKADAPAPLGLDQFRRLRAAIDLPVVAIGGIDAAQAGEVIAAGADGIAVVSAICTADDPQAASRNLLDRIEQARARGA